MVPRTLATLPGRATGGWAGSRTTAGSVARRLASPATRWAGSSPVARAARRASRRMRRSGSSLQRRRKAAAAADRLSGGDHTESGTAHMAPTLPRAASTRSLRQGPGLCRPTARATAAVKSPGNPPRCAAAVAATTGLSVRAAPARKPSTVLGARSAARPTKASTMATSTRGLRSPRGGIAAPGSTR